MILLVFVIMALAILAEPATLSHSNPDGVVRVGGTRVTLDTSRRCLQARGNS
jgi:hypothetical protein